MSDIPRRPKRDVDLPPYRHPRDPIDPTGPITPAPPAPTPDPWPPTFALHLYGMNWDFEGWETTAPDTWADLRGALERTLSAVLRAPASVEFAFDSNYTSPTGPISVLSIGAWSGPTTNAARAARKRGLRAARSSGMRDKGGELLVSALIVAAQIRAALPARIANAPAEVKFVSSSVTAIAPAGFGISAIYGVDSVLGYNEVSATTSLGLSASGGRLNVALAPLAFSASGIPPLVFNPLTWLLAGTGALALVYTVIQNVGSGRPALPNFGLGNLNLTDLSAINRLLIGPLRVDLTFNAPGFVNGVVSLNGVLRLPFAYTLSLRQPSVTISAPAAVTMTLEDSESSAEIAVRANTTDINRPRFAWTVDGQPADPRPAGKLLLSSENLRVGGRQSFRVGVTATDALDPALTAHAEVQVTGTARRGTPIELPPHR